MTTKGSPRIVWGGSLVAVTFATIAAVSVVSAPDDEVHRGVLPPVRRSERPETSTTAAPSPPLDPPLVAPEAPPQPRLTEAREVPDLLALTFLERDVLVRLRSTLEPRTVTVINVWATWCLPCRREFAELRKLLSGWKDVRFIPIQLGDDPPDELVKEMPDAAHRLVDLVSGGNIQRTLRSLGLAGDDKRIPITLVLDCQYRLHALHLAELRDFDEFARAIEALRAELRTSTCALAPPNPAGSPRGGAAVAAEDITAVPVRRWEGGLAWWRGLPFLPIRLPLSRERMCPSR
jgi:thiol-disulfide isomerase/thioredoxin